MKTLLESIFDDDLAEAPVITGFEEWIDEDPWDSYRAIIEYLLKFRDEKVFPDELRNMAKIIKKEYYKSIDNRYTYCMEIEAEVCDEIWRDEDGDPVDVNPMDDVVTDLANLAYMQGSKDDVARIEKLDKSWINTINEYLEYSNQKKFCPDCPNYVAMILDESVVIVGFPKKTPKFLLNLFGIK